MPSRQPLPPPLRLFVLVSFLLTGLCGGTELFCKLGLHLHFPYTFPIIDPGAISMDLLFFRPAAPLLHHRAFFDAVRFSYPAPVAIPYAVFFSLPNHARLLYYLFSLAVVGTAGALFGRELVRRGLAPRTAAVFLGASFLLSYPFWFQLKQANMEIVIFALLAAGTWAFCRGHGWTAAACLGVAGSMKLYPFIFLGLFLARRRTGDYLRIAFGLAVAAVVTVASLWMLYPSIPYSWKRTNEAVNGFRFDYVLHTRPDHHFDHSLWGFLKTFLPLHLSTAQLSRSANLYLLCVGTLGLALYVWRMQRLPVLNQIACLTVAALLLMPVSFDYTLIQLYIPWALWVLLALKAAEANDRVPGLHLVFLCLVLLCSPLTEFIVHGVTVEGRLKMVVLSVLFWAALRYPFHLDLPACDNGTARVP